MLKKESPKTKEMYIRNAEIYKIMSNPIRLEILNLLKDKELTVNELSKIIKIFKSNTSQHLTILKARKLVKVRKEGQKSYYTLTSPLIVKPCEILNELSSQRLI